MFLFDIAIYLLLAWAMSALAYKSCEESHDDYVMRYNESTVFWDKYLVWFIVFFSFISAIRWNVGSDSITYAVWLDRGSISNNGESLFALFVKFIKGLGIHWSIGLGILSFIQILFIVKSTKGFKFILIALPFVLFGCRYWLDLAGAVRQMVAACIFLWGSKYIFEKNLWKFAFMIFVCSLIHRSSLFLIPLFLIPSYWHIEHRRIFLFIILISCLTIGLIPSYQNYISLLSNILDTTGYEYYIKSSTLLLEQGETSETLKFGPMMLSYILVEILIIWFGPELRKNYAGMIPCFDLWFILSFIYSCLFFLVCNISHLFIRPTLYLGLFQMMMASLLLYHVSVKYLKQGVNQLQFILVVCVILMNMSWCMYKESNKNFEFSTYKVFFMHKDQLEWFNL